MHSISLHLTCHIIMTSNMVTIVLDTGFLVYDFSCRSFQDFIRPYVKEGLLQVVVPEIVIFEHDQQIQEKPPPSENVDECIEAPSKSLYYRTDERARQFDELDVQIIRKVYTDEELDSRTRGGLPPCFGKNDNQQGYRDTKVWLSARYAWQKFNGSVILASQDKRAFGEQNELKIYLKDEIAKYPKSHGEFRWTHERSQTQQLIRELCDEARKLRHNIDNNNLDDESLLPIRIERLSLNFLRQEFVGHRFENSTKFVPHVINGATFQVQPSGEVIFDHEPRCLYYERQRSGPAVITALIRCRLIERGQLIPVDRWDCGTSPWLEANAEASQILPCDILWTVECAVTIPGEHVDYDREIYSSFVCSIVKTTIQPNLVDRCK